MNAPNSFSTYAVKFCVGLVLTGVIITCLFFYGALIAWVFTQMFGRSGILPAFIFIAASIFSACFAFSTDGNGEK